MSPPSPAERIAQWAAAAEADLLSRRRRMQGIRPNLRRTRGRIAVLTDSASALPLTPEGTPDLGVLGEQLTVVPIPVMIDYPHNAAQIYPEASAELDRDLPLAMAQGIGVRTSRPSPGRLSETFRRLQSQGFAGIVAIHLSAKLSGTVDAARLAAEDVQIPVSVVDSEQAGLGQGEAVIEAAITARLGGTLREVVETAEGSAAAADSLFVVPSLEQLRRGGRINRLSSLVGSLMGVKPLLGLRSGEVVLLERPRSLPRAVERLRDSAVQSAAAYPEARLGVHCFGNPEAGAALADELAVHSAAPVPVIELPPALAAHMGLGALAICVTAGAQH